LHNPPLFVGRRASRDDGTVAARLYAGDHWLVGLEPFIEELLNRVEQLHAVLLHADACFERKD
jgi:hypothetical protein